MKAEIIGLVFCGGKSSRMGQDKMWLDYHGKPQVYHVYEQLAYVCKKAFISCNQQQFKTILKNYDCIIDDESFGNIGPMKGLLTAFKTFPQSSFLVIGCDYPFFGKEEIYSLHNYLNKYKKSTAYYQAKERIYEPLLAGYHNSIYSQLNEKLRERSYSLRQFLEETNAEKLEPANPDILKSIDTKKDYIAAVAALKQYAVKPTQK